MLLSCGAPAPLAFIVAHPNAVFTESPFSSRQPCAQCRTAAAEGSKSRANQLLWLRRHQRLAFVYIPAGMSFTGKCLLLLVSVLPWLDGHRISKHAFHWTYHDNAAMACPWLWFCQGNLCPAQIGVYGDASLGTVVMLPNSELLVPTSKFKLSVHCNCTATGICDAAHNALPLTSRDGHSMWPGLNTG